MESIPAASWSVRVSGGCTKDRLGDKGVDLVREYVIGTCSVKGDDLIHLGGSHKVEGGNYLPHKHFSGGLMCEDQLDLFCSGVLG